MQLYADSGGGQKIGAQQAAENYVSRIKNKLSRDNLEKCVPRQMDLRDLKMNRMNSFDDNKVVQQY